MNDFINYLKATYKRNHNIEIDDSYFSNNEIRVIETLHSCIILMEHLIFVDIIEIDENIITLCFKNDMALFPLKYNKCTDYNYSLISVYIIDLQETINE